MFNTDTAHSSELTACHCLQLKARARITLKPLVETIPCLGSVTISLLESPTVDLALMLINQLDIMAFPGLNLAANLVLKMVSLMLIPCSLLT